ncbi:hypothetical protein P0082_03870 [Candidatus Haliotispira prima]|uniref:Uncharacterized protein n=1 Tax=Candidatus Haliotispira prima TaxID=3034016 RepID=A0ABY8MJD9_9SPIO|nr:hypothetical protein P0082_03870 [Candidatus Haliotispira prima]
MKNRGKTLMDIKVNGVISNIESAKTLSKKSLLKTKSCFLFLNNPTFFCLFLFFFLHLFLSGFAELAADSHPKPPYMVSFQTEGNTLNKLITGPTRAPNGGITGYFGNWYTVDVNTGKIKYDYIRSATDNIAIYARRQTKQLAERLALEESPIVGLAVVFFGF